MPLLYQTHLFNTKNVVTQLCFHAKPGVLLISISAFYGEG
jgi:hypothetical protein